MHMKLELLDCASQTLRVWKPVKWLKIGSIDRHIPGHSLQYLRKMGHDPVYDTHGVSGQKNHLKTGTGSTSGSTAGSTTLSVETSSLENVMGPNKQGVVRISNFFLIAMTSGLLAITSNLVDLRPQFLSSCGKERAWCWHMCCSSTAYIRSDRWKPPSA